MATKILSILLAVSLGFNVFCTVGSLHNKKMMRLAHSPQGRWELMAKELDLTEEQYQRLQQRRQRMGPKRQDFLDELIKDEPDQKLLERLALEKLALRQEFMSDLTLEQRQKFVKMINKRFSLSRRTDTGRPAK